MEIANSKDSSQIYPDNKNNNITPIAENEIIYPHTGRDKAKSLETVNPEKDSNINNNNGNNKSNTKENFNFELIESINLKLRKLSTAKDSPWTMKNFPKEKIKSYQFIIDHIKSIIEAKNPNALKSGNYRIVLRINKNDNLSSLTVFKKEDWEMLFNSTYSNDLRNFIIINKNMNIYTLKVEYELQDFNRKFNECAGKCDLNNKIIDNLIYCTSNNDKIKKELLENLCNKILKDKASDKYTQEIIKKPYIKLLQDYADKVYETLFNSLKNFKSLQEDLNQLNLDRELDFYKFDDSEENKNTNVETYLNDSDDVDNENNFSINFRSSYNPKNQDELISRLITETKNSYKK